MKNTITVVLSLLITTIALSQNLVPNPSFEDNNSCPATGGISSSIGWINASDGTADYYNACDVYSWGNGVPSNSFGYQPARTGNAYAGMIFNWVISAPNIDQDYREYIQIQLTSPLVAGVEYNVEFYWNTADNSTHYVENLGAHLSNTQLNFNQGGVAINLTPQVSVSGSPLNDNVNWVLFSQSFVASGGESFLTIGNFNNPSNTVSGLTGVPSGTMPGGVDFGYYYIDDVSVKAVNCFEIEKILVDACDNHNQQNPDEGKNEMVTFRVGSQDLNVANLSVNWPSSNPWGGVVQNAITTQLITTINSSITACGYVKEPIGGVLPAGKEVLLITSYEFNPLAHSFANLNDTLIVIFQDATTGAGHFRNYNSSSVIKTLEMSFSTPNGCSDQVSYNINLLVNQSGTSGGTSAEKDGAFVSFEPNGTASYNNLGCQVPTGILSIDISSNISSVCGGSIINLDAEIEGLNNGIIWSSNQGVFSADNSTPTTMTVNNGAANSFYIYGGVISYCDTILDSLLITVNNPTVSIATSNNLLCTGQTVTLTASGADTYLWNNGSTTNPLVITAGGNYSVTGTNGCGNDNDAITISEMQAPTPIIVPSPMYSCDSNELHQVDLSTNVCDNCTYTWSDGSTGTQFSGNEPNYSVTIQNACGTQTVNYNYTVITVLADITVQDSIGNAPFTVPFSSVSSSGEYSWDFDNGNSIGFPYGIENPIETFNQSGEYLVTLTISEMGCTATAYQTIIVNGSFSLPTGVIIPNIFTPNGDGENDAFFIETINGSNMSGSIFNRWGRKVHELNGLDAKWNGGKYNEGTYYYIIKVTFADGSTKEYEGSFMMTK